MTASRLDQIATSVTIMEQLQKTLPSLDKERAWESFVGRYERPVRNYLLALVRSPELVGDLYAEFLKRCVASLVKRFDPAKGRFRDYVKETLINLARSAWARRAADKHVALPVDFDPPAPAPAEPDFDTLWRDSLVLRALTSLESWATAAKRPHYVVLRHKMDHPETRSHELAEHCTTALGKPVSAPWVRKALHEARHKLAELIVAEVRATTMGDVREELAELGLLEQCRRALE